MEEEGEGEVEVGEEEGTWDYMDCPHIISPCHMVRGEEGRGGGRVGEGGGGKEGGKRELSGKEGGKRELSEC